MIYLDHAATSWPKPPEVIRAMTEFLERTGGNPGRSGHSLSVAAGRAVYETREVLCRFFNAPDPLRVIFTHNATHAINIALTGLLKPDDLVVTTSVEHNSVMRPLRELERRGTRLRIVPCDRTGALDLAAYARALAERPRLVVLNHASNVTGCIMPIADLARAARASDSLVLVDAAQTAGLFSIDTQAMGIDLLAFTGHKGLEGPQGTGGLVIGDSVDHAELIPVIRGGTGSGSGSEEQPEALPDKLESGTPNGPGIAGLGAAVRWISEIGLDAIRAHHEECMLRLVSGLEAIDGVTVYGPPAGAPRAPLVSFTVAGVSASNVAGRLDDEFAIMCRAGLHCAPAAHRTVGTYPGGAVRFSIGPMTTLNEIDSALAAVRKVAAR